jgi:hypothetical protein
MQVSKTIQRAEVTEILKNHFANTEVTGIKDFTVSFGSDNSVTVSYDTMLTKPSLADTLFGKATNLAKDIRDRF